MIETFHTLKPVILVIAMLTGLALQNANAKGEHSWAATFHAPAMETAIG